MAHTTVFRSLIRVLQAARRANLAAAGAAPPVEKGGPRLSRRDFLKTTVAGGVGLTTGMLARPATTFAGLQSDSQPRIAVIGGGLAGLNAAYQLKKAGFEATVYEARSRLGGRVYSLDNAVGDGLTLDLGGSFINSDHGDMLALIEEFGLPLFNRPAAVADLPDPLSGYYFAGRSYSEAEVAAALRPLAAQITADADLLDQDFELHAPDFDAVSVTQYLDQHSDLIAAPFVRTLIENSIRTEYGVEPGESPALQLLYLLPTVDGERVEVLGASDELYVVQGGSGKLVAALSKALEGQIRTRMRLAQLAATGDGYELTFQNGDVVAADFVVIAVPFPALRRVDLQVDLPATLRRFIAELKLGRNEKLFAGFKQRAWRRPDGFTLDAWTDIGAAAVWDATLRQTERSASALTFFTSGAEVAAARFGGARYQGRRLVGELDRFLPGLAEAASGRFARTAWHRSFLTGGSYVNFAPGQYSEFAGYLYIEAADPEERQDVAVGNLVFAGEHLSDAYYGFMNGAAETGRLAAEYILREIAVPA